MKTAVVVPCSRAQSARGLLEAHGLWDKTRKLQKHDIDHVLIPVNTADKTVLAHHLQQTESSIVVIQADLPPSKSQQLVTPAQQLLYASRELLKQCDIQETELERLLAEVPSHWEKHGDLVLLPANAFVSQEWSLLGGDLWSSVAACVGARRVARQSVVSADGFRSPQVVLLHGDDAVVQHIDNGIKYEYDLTKCMFSVGNITEKLRVAKFNCSGETVVDLYAGIGYFTLPYLVHAGASHVHACEWNPEAVTALTRNLQLNRVEDHCTIHPGDNRNLQLRGIADRVNLGLIPSSEDGWPVACRVLKPTGGMMHVHGNINNYTAVGERHPDDSDRGLDINRTTACEKQTVNMAQNCSAEGMSVQCNSDHKEVSEEEEMTISVEDTHPDRAKSETLHSALVHVHRGCHPTECHTQCSSSKQYTQTDKLLKESNSSRCKSMPWHQWGQSVCDRLQTLLEEEHGGSWQTTLMHIEPVKSYAPHVYHVVLDIRCSPVTHSDCSSHPC